MLTLGPWLAGGVDQKPAHCPLPSVIMGVPSRVTISFDERVKPEAHACTIYITYHTGELEYVDTNGVSTRLSPVQYCNTGEIVFSYERKHAS